ncbi:MAG: hypothetical protein RL473_645 [Actinomycetota bacterium]|jgi:hypothetical protein
MWTTRIRVNSLVAVIAASATMFSYCLTSQALDSQPTDVHCTNTLDLAALSNLTKVADDPDQFVALTCGHVDTSPQAITTAVALRNLNP